MIIDRHAGELTFEGNPKVTQAWLHTMIDLDESPNASVVTRLFESNLLQGKTVQQVVFMAAAQDEEIERQIPLPSSGNLKNLRQGAAEQGLLERVTIRYLSLIHI